MYTEDSIKVNRLFISLSFFEIKDFFHSTTSLKSFCYFQVYAIKFKPADDDGLTVKVVTPSGDIVLTDVRKFSKRLFYLLPLNVHEWNSLIIFLKKICLAHVHFWGATHVWDLCFWLLVTSGFQRLIYTWQRQMWYTFPEIPSIMAGHTSHFPHMHVSTEVGCWSPMGGLPLSSQTR